MFRTLPLGLTAALAATVLAQGSLSAEAARGSGMGPGEVQFTDLHIPAKPSAAPSDPCRGAHRRSRSGRSPVARSSRP